MAKGLCFGTLGATSEELADPELVSDDTLLLILYAALIARYGPEVMNIGRPEVNVDQPDERNSFSGSRDRRWEEWYDGVVHLQGRK